MKDFLQRLASRKFILAILGIAIFIWNASHPEKPLNETELLELASIILAYIGIEGAADYKSRS